MNQAKEGSRQSSPGRHLETPKEATSLLGGPAPYEPSHQVWRPIASGYLACLIRNVQLARDLAGHDLMTHVPASGHSTGAQFHPSRCLSPLV